MIKKNTSLVDKDIPKFIFSLSLTFIYTLFLICVKWSTDSVKLGRRE